MSIETKLCGKCGIHHPATTEFFPLQKGSMWSPCKPCRNKARRERARRSPELTQKAKARSLKWAYGLSIEAYDAMVEAHGGLCAICKTAFNSDRKEPFVDHCHDTGAVRGLLCLGCNSALGHFKDSEQSLENAINYLKGSRRATLQGKIDYSRYL